jgi:beta-N-acetylhexosaminidase
MIKRIFGSIVIVLIANFFVCAQSGKQKWVDSVFNQLTEVEKIGQLFIFPLSSHIEDAKTERIERDLKAGNLGGLLFTGGHPVNQVSLTNRFQQSSKVPLMIAMEASEGLGHRLDSTLRFPSPLALGAIDSDLMMLEMSREIGRELKLLGVHLNIGPTANLLDQTENIYRTDRYGEDRNIVTKKLLSHLRGMQENGIISCTREFPVHGVTLTDLKKGMPSLRIFVDSTMNSTFNKLINQKVEAIMPGPSQIPLFYEKKKIRQKNKFTSPMLTTFFTGEWLKRQMNYEGLVVIDIRSLEAATGKDRIADGEMLAFKTGNDLIISDNNPATSIRKIRKLIKKEKEYEALLNRTVKRILSAKYDAGLSVRSQISSENLVAKLNTPESKVLQQQLFRASVTVIKNEKKTIPVQAIEDKNIATISLGDTTGIQPFNHVISKYVPAKKISLREGDSLAINNILQKYDLVIASITPSTSKDILEKFARQVATHYKEGQVILADLGSPYLKDYISMFETVIAGFDNSSQIKRVVPQIIFGAEEASGMLPLTISDLKPGSQTFTSTLKRLSYSIPEDASMSSKTLKKIEGIAKEAISISGTPGCHVFVARNGKVVYEKSFGHYTYDKLTPVTDSTIYDLASVTKVSATLQAVMFLYDRGMIDLNKKASFYLPELKNSNKKDFTVKDILTHQAGLWPFIPFYVQTMKDNNYLPGFYSDKPSLEFPRMVANKLYTYGAMPDSLWSWAIKGKIREKPPRTPFDYKYSDIGFYIMAHLAERLLNQPLQDFVSQNLYEPLGAYTTGYLPLLRFPATRIAPTEDDKTFRKTLLVGTVHDPGAAMHGGIAGHAGLFSTANDLGKLGQMLLQEGYYGGYQYYKPETVRLFSQRAYESNHRGLGWAKSIQSDPSSPTSLFASPKTFGHTGYTGTCIWIDPEFNLVYIFLSNRVHPDVSTKLLSANIRSRIQDVIYESIFDYCSTHPEQKENVNDLSADAKY